MYKLLSKSVGFIGYVIKYGCWTHCTFEYIGDFVICSGPSMEPTLYTNNILITERISPRFHRIIRGDVIIATNPINPTQNICKRVVGLPGDRIVTDKIYGNIIPLSNSGKTSKCIPATKSVDHPMESPDKFKNLRDRNNNNNNSKSTSDDDNNSTWSEKIFKKVVIVPRGHVWIEGDNADNSSDSRSYGPIPQGLIKSRAVLRLWPFTDIKML